MLTRRKRLPIDALEGLKWDLGLPDDYARSLLPDYPDYFQVVPSESPDHGPLDLELVCWIKDLAVSALEEKSESAALTFPLHFTSGFEPEKKLMRRIEEWQRLPYISPYEEGGARLDPKGDQHEKWAVGVLHEVLHLMVSKKCEKWDLLRLGEHLGPKSAVFKRAVASHTGIFYVSHKNRTKVVLLREAYRRDRLLVEHPLVGVRYRYVHLMRKNSGGANDKREEPLHEEEEEEERGDLLEDSDDYVDDDDEEEVEIVGNFEKVNQSDHMDSIRGQLRKSKSTHRSISRRRDIRRKVERNAGS
ncbi:hypothetical protein QJS10_CPB22g00091 [Acorus calamus]|uniref:PORR domain-containing protein n=1 Tax=Acorus calamus TaxID=4465 RepID=A0AAV9C2T2_ACOCL|nr:hypothetical protein QJS10_CPB22g00091 [Acorus calamus]